MNKTRTSNNAPTIPNRIKMKRVPIEKNYLWNDENGKTYGIVITTTNEAMIDFLSIKEQPESKRNSNPVPINV